MKAQWNWRAVAMFLVVVVAVTAGWMMVPSVSEAASCQGAPAPCAEDPAIQSCTVCHSMGITGGNRNGTDRMITVSAASNRHILGPPLASWLSTVQGMISKGATGDANTIAAYLDTNYCPTCTGPIMSSPMLSDVGSDQVTVGWITSGSDYGDLAATSCVLYGTSLTTMTGDTCNASDPSYDPNSGNPVTNHSVTVTGLTGLTNYFFAPRSVAGGNTATWAGAVSTTTLPGIGPPGGGGLGTIVSLAVGDYNNDLNLDLGVGVSSKNHVIAYLGNGAGGFTEGQTLANVGTTPSAITSGGVKGDFNEDGLDDLAVANFGEESQNVAIFFGTSPSGWQTTAVSTIPLSAPPTSVVTGDFNEDGVLDIAVATVETDGSLGHVLLFAGENDGSGHGTGNFTGPITQFDVQITTVLAPVVTSIVPDTVSCLGLPTQITINGSLLLPSATVTLDGTLPMPVVSGSPDNTSLVVSVPNTATAGTHSVVVTLGSLPPGSGTLVISPRPVTITSVSPASKIYGIDPDGQVLISGTNFLSGARVTIGSLTGITVPGTSASAATPFVWVASTALRVWVGSTALPTGAHDVTVENLDGCAGSATVPGGFTMTAPQPTVNSVSPASVTYGVTTSQSVTIAGSNFVSGAVINVGSLTGAAVPGTVATATTPFVYVSSSTLRFWWPNTGLSPASYTVNVTNPAAAGGLTGSKADGFVVTAPQPTISSVSPTSVTYGVSPSQQVTITGSNFVLGAGIAVQGPGGTWHLAGGTVAGTSASATTPFVFVSSGTLRFWWPNTSVPPGVNDIVVSNPAAAGGATATLAASFTVIAPVPTITGASPNSVTYGITPSSQIQVFGSNFIVGAQVTIGSLSGTTVAGTTASASVPFVHVSSGTIKFWWPNTALPPGPYAIQVTNPAAAGSQSATLAAAFTVVAPQPTVTGASPSPRTYAIDASTSVTVSGTNFVLGAGIAIQDSGGSWLLSGGTVAGSVATAATPYVYVSSGTLRFWWPNTALPPGTYSIVVANPPAAGGESTTQAGAFVVTAPTPAPTAISPNTLTAGVSPSQQLTISGSNFVVGAGIAVQSSGGAWLLAGGTVQGTNASAGTPFVFVNSGQLRIWWPNTSLPAGVYDIVVTNPVAAGGQTATLAGALTVN